jgi:hypothetical protein
MPSPSAAAVPGLVPLEVARLVERLTYGPTAAELERAAKLGVESYLDYHLGLAPEVDAALEAEILGRYPRLTWSAQQLQGLGYNNESGDQLIGATLTRRHRSLRQLYERTVEFWSDHFNVSLAKTGPALLIQHDRDAIRRFALTSFPQLLKATAQSSAMLAYLDNDQSNATYPCQNYARELLELHTIGVGNYSQKDVREVARCLSGWTFVREEASPDFGKFRFDTKRHDNGPKTVLGTSIPAGGGMTDGHTVLDLLADHPLTARRLATKMTRWILGETAPPDAIASVENAYRVTGGDIRSMIRTAVRHPSFGTGPRRIKRPAHLFIGIVRALEAKVTSWQDVRYGALRQLGHVPFEWPLPNGYPDTVAPWADQLLPRWNFPFALLNNGVGGISVDFGRIFPPPYTPGRVVDQIERVLYPTGMPKVDKTALNKFLAAVSYLDATRSRAAVALAIAMNEYQWTL